MTRDPLEDRLERFPMDRDVLHAGVVLQPGLFLAAEFCPALPPASPGTCSKIPKITVTRQEFPQGCPALPIPVCTRAAPFTFTRLPARLEGP